MPMSAGNMKVSDSVLRNVRDLLSSYEETQIVTTMIEENVTFLEALLLVLASREAKVI